MHRIFRSTLLSLLLVMGMMTASWGTPVSPEKMKAYAEIYPDIFEISMHPVTNRPAGNKGEAVKLLLQSFNGDTNVEELSATLQPGDYASVKQEQQIRALLASRNIQWHEYQEITRNLSRDPALLKTFMVLLDPARVQQELLSQATENPSFVQNIGSSEHRAIMKHLIVHFKE